MHVGFTIPIDVQSFCAECVIVLSPPGRIIFVGNACYKYERPGVLCTEIPCPRAMGYDRKRISRRKALYTGSISTVSFLAGCGTSSNMAGEESTCPSVKSPPTPEIKLGTDQFHQEMLNTVAALRKPWEESTSESVQQMAEQTQEEAINLLLPGIRDQILPDSVSNIQSLIQATTHSFNQVAEAGSILMKTEFRNSTEEIGLRTLNRYYTEIDRPLTEKPDPEIELSTTVDLPRNQPFCTLANILDISLRHPLYDRISAEQARERANTVNNVLTQWFLPHLKNKDFTLEDGEPVSLSGCSTEDDEFAEDGRVAALIYNLELLAVTAQTIVNAFDEEIEGRDNSNTEDDSASSSDIENAFEWLINPVNLIEEDLVTGVGGADIYIRHPQAIFSALSIEVENPIKVYPPSYATMGRELANQSHLDVLTNIRDGFGINATAFNVREDQIIGGLEETGLSPVELSIDTYDWSLFEGSDLFGEEYTESPGPHENLRTALVAVKGNKTILVPVYEASPEISTINDKKRVMEIALATFEGELDGFIAANHFAADLLREFRKYKNSPTDDRIRNLVEGAQGYGFRTKIIKESELDSNDEDTSAEESEVGRGIFQHYDDSQVKLVEIPIFGDSTFRLSGQEVQTYEFSN